MHLSSLLTYHFWVSLMDSRATPESRVVKCHRPVRVFSEVFSNSKTYSVDYALCRNIPVDCRHPGGTVGTVGHYMTVGTVTSVVDCRVTVVLTVDHCHTTVMSLSYGLSCSCRVAVV